MLLPLYFFHINKQQLCEAFTHSTLLLHLCFHKAFKQVSGLKPVQNLKKNCWGISPMESCMKSMLESLWTHSVIWNPSVPTLWDIPAMVGTAAHSSHAPGLPRAGSPPFPLQGHQTSF